MPTLKELMGDKTRGDGMKNRSGFSCEESDVYLGDGVYAKMDDSYSQVWLMLQSGEAIALDHWMVDKLKQFMDSVPRAH